MCGDECPPSEWTQEYSADPWTMTMYEPCGKSHYTMVGRPFIKSIRRYHRSTPPPTQTTPTGSVQLMGGQNPDSLVSFPSLRLEGGQFNLSNCSILQIKSDIFVDLYLKVGHMVTGLFSGKRPTSRGEYDSYTLRWGVG